VIEPVIPLRALEHFAYCPRQAAIIHVDGVWADNQHTVRGVRGHRRVDEAPSRHERGRRVLRGIRLFSEQLGLTGRADAVEVLQDGSVEPVEYKHGTRHGNAAEIQLCAQALCLEEMLGISIPMGRVWYAGSRRGDQIVLGDPIRKTTIDTIAAVRALYHANTLPAAVNDPRCDECQLRGSCLPELVAHLDHLRAYHQKILSCE
jgi:CRISPR-associated exonuclease Cas4